MNRITATWWNTRCFRKMDDHPVHTIPNHHPTKMKVLPKTFVQIILAAKWFVRLSNTSPNQHRRPLPSLLSLSFFYDCQPSMPVDLCCQPIYCYGTLIRCTITENGLYCTVQYYSCTRITTLCDFSLPL